MEVYLWVFNFISREMKISVLSKHFSLDDPSITKKTAVTVSLIDGRSDIYEVRVIQTSCGKLYLSGGQAIGTTEEAVDRSVLLRSARSGVTAADNDRGDNGTTTVTQGVYYISLSTMPSCRFCKSTYLHTYSSNTFLPVPCSASTHSKCS